MFSLADNVGFSENFFVLHLVNIFPNLRCFHQRYCVVFFLRLGGGMSLKE